MDHDELVIYKLKTVYLRKVTNVVNNDVVIKIMFDKLVTKVKVVDNNGFVLKSQSNNEILEIENKTDDARKKILGRRWLLQEQIIILRPLKLKAKYLVLLV